MRAYAQWWVAVAGLFLLASPTFAQEAGQAGAAAPEKDKGRPTRLMIELESWLAQPAGLNYAPVALVDPSNPFENQILDVDHGVTARTRARFGYSLPGSIGDIVLTWWSQDDREPFVTTDPGNFQYLGLLTPPAYGGINDDGLSDGYSYEARTMTRDLRIDYYREAFHLPKVTGRWYVGYRRVSHRRNLDAEYFAVAPNLPPIVFPLPTVDVTPRPDTATSGSRFSGRGLEAGIEVEIPVSSRVRVQFGAGIAALRGNTSAAYQALTNLYILSQTGNTVDEVLTQPFDEFNDPNLVGNIVQAGFPVAVRIPSESSTAQVQDLFLSVRWQVLKTLDLFAGFRDVRYDNVGVEIRPAFVSRDVVGHGLQFVQFQEESRFLVQDVDAQGLSRSSRSAGYEGFYAGITYRY